MKGKRYDCLMICSFPCGMVLPMFCLRHVVENHARRQFTLLTATKHMQAVMNLEGLADHLMDCSECLKGYFRMRMQWIRQSYTPMPCAAMLAS